VLLVTQVDLELLKLLLLVPLANPPNKLHQPLDNQLNRRLLLLVNLPLPLVALVLLRTLDQHLDKGPLHLVLLLPLVLVQVLYN
jgi:hypothetical protein